MTISLHFPSTIEALAVRSPSAEYAWQRNNLPQVFAYCRTAALAILGGEAWIVRPIEACGPDDPTEPIHNLDPQRRRMGSVLARSTHHVIYGSLLLRDGQQAVFSWSTSPRDPDQSWPAFVAMTVDETWRIIEQSKLETDIIPDYAAYVYYNLMFERPDGSWF